MSIGGGREGLRFVMMGEGLLAACRSTDPAVSDRGGHRIAETEGIAFDASLVEGLEIA